MALYSTFTLVDVHIRSRLYGMSPSYLFLDQLGIIVGPARAILPPRRNSPSFKLNSSETTPQDPILSPSYTECLASILMQQVSLRKLQFANIDLLEPLQSGSPPNRPCQTQPACCSSVCFAELPSQRYTISRLLKH
jgi:hypothetical protein